MKPRGTDMLSKGTNIFQVMGSTQPLIVMHPKYIDEIKNHPDLSFTDAIKRVS